MLTVRPLLQSCCSPLRTWARRIDSFQSHYDVCIVGGGIMGCSSAFFLANRIKPSSVCVIEKDPTYSTASTVLAVGGIRQQFSVAENIKMSQYGAEFFKNVNHHLLVPGGDPVDVNFEEHGYLFLASEKEQHILRENHEFQRNLGAQALLLGPNELANRFPWLETKELALGCLGIQNEGWFDPWLLLNSFKKKVVSLGVPYLHGTVESVQVAEKHVKAVKVFPKGADSPVSITCHYLVNCAGPSATEVARMAGIGSNTSTMAALSDDENSVLRVELPVHMRKRMVFVFSCREAMFTGCPMVILPGGAYFRREGKEGGTFICGQAPPSELDVDSPELTIDYNFFDETIWPHIANYVPAFNSLKVQHAWAGYYDYNTFDQNAIIGAHPVIKNFIFCNGFSGHGLQQSVAAGRAVSEIVLDGESVSLNLKRLGFEQIILGTPLEERNVV